MKEMVGVWAGDCQWATSKNSETIALKLTIEQDKTVPEKFFVKTNHPLHQYLPITTIEWSTYSQKWEGKQVRILLKLPPRILN